MRFILEETQVPPDLLFIQGYKTPSRGAGGLYTGNGIAFIFPDADEGVGVGALHVCAHEIAHAHQHALVFGGRYNWVDDWVNAPEGRAFAKAKERDWAEVGKTKYDSRSHFNSLWENAAETSAHYWSIGTEWEGENIEEIAPNRFRWAEEWLKKK